MSAFPLSLETVIWGTLLPSVQSTGYFVPFDIQKVLDRRCTRQFLQHGNSGPILKWLRVYFCLQKEGKNG